MEQITSRNNPSIKAAAALKESSERRRTGLFLLEGARLCYDAAVNGNYITEFFVTEEAAEKYPREFSLLLEKAEKSCFITDNVSDKLSDTKNSQQFFCVCREKKQAPEISFDGTYIFLDNIQNPDNLGAVVRTAEAFGADGLIINSGCDIYSPKAQRAAMGALLRFPVIRTSDAPSLLSLCKEKGMSVYGSVVTSDAESVLSPRKNGGQILIIGNEGRGISDEILSCCTHRITIPMKGKAESLNASASAAVLIWEFTKNS